MKLNVIKLHIIAIIVVAFVLGCNKTNEKDFVEKLPEENPTELVNSTLYKLILGKWQLLQVDEVFTPEPPSLSHDYSEYNIVYELKTNGVLTVSGEIEDVDTYRGHTIGNHTYSFIDDDNQMGNPSFPFGLQIDALTSWYKISSEELIINNSPMDGFIYSLIKTTVRD